VGGTKSTVLKYRELQSRSCALETNIAVEVNLDGSGHQVLKRVCRSLITCWNKFKTRKFDLNIQVKAIYVETPRSKTAIALGDAFYSWEVKAIERFITNGRLFDKIDSIWRSTLVI
jgi:hypothetical protein